MVFNSDELEIIEYLKSWKGEFVSVAEICRRAGGRRKFVESPNWAKLMMARLVDAGVVVVNDRGHFGYGLQNATAAQSRRSENAKQSIPNSRPRLATDDYFPEAEGVHAAEETVKPTMSGPQIVDEDYFPGAEEPLFTSISRPVVRTESEATVIDEDYFPAEEEPLFTSISKPAVQEDAGVSSPLVVDEDYLPGSDESKS